MEEWVHRSWIPLMNYWKILLNVKGYAPVNFLWKWGEFMIYGPILPFYTQLVIVSTMGMNYWKILMDAPRFHKKLTGA
jgi:hypothetical protein